MVKSSFKDQSYYDESTNILSGPEFKPYYDRNCSIGKIAFEELRRRPNHICQICDSDNTRLTNEDVRLQGIRLARFFESLGLRQNDIVGFSGRNTTFAMSVPLACFFTGIACHAISPFHDKATLKKLFNITQPKVIFFDGQDIEKIRFASSDFETKIVTISNHVKDVPSILDLLKPTGDEHEFEPAELENGPDQNLYLLCTSGSTGTPKVATVPNSTPYCRGISKFTDQDILFRECTLDWNTGLGSVLNCVVYGMVRVITETPFTAEIFFKIIEKYKVTHIFLTPPLTTMVVNSPLIAPEKFNNVRNFNIAGSTSPPGLLDELQKYICKTKIMPSYGCTELNFGLSNMIHSENKPGSLGRILPGYKARVVNEKGENLKKNQIGELCVARPGFWGGFYNNPEATREVYDENGWLYTGDLGYIDDDNYLFMVGRKKELLKYKAMHYYPKDIEDIIYEIPDVKEVCVFGIQDEFGEDKAAAAIVKMEGSTLKEQDVIDYVQKITDAEHKQLHAGCKFFNAIPKTTNNKYDRNAAKKVFLSESKNIVTHK